MALFCFCSLESWAMLRAMQRPLYIQHTPADPFETARTQQRKSVPPQAALRIIRRSEIGPQPMPLIRRAGGTEEVDICEVLEEIDLHPEQRAPLVSVNATQELSADDVLEARNAPVVDYEVDAFVDRHERPSESPFVIDTSELHVDRSRLTVLSTSEIVRRQKRGGMVVGAVVGLALAVLCVAGATQVVPMTGSDRLESTTPLLARGHKNDLAWQHSHLKTTASVASRIYTTPAPLTLSVYDLPKSRRR